MKKILISIFSFIYLFLLGTPLSSVNVTLANEIIYTDVLTDLKKDDNFDESKYPKISDNYLIEVIQIAESSDKELFIYTYNPSTKRKATHISISPILSTNGNSNAIWTQYDLTYLNSYETLDKYVVKNFKIKDDLIRYYDIARISTNVLNNVDEQEENGNVLNYISFEVGKQWTIKSNSNGDVSISREDTDTIIVTDKYVGKLRYKDGFFLVDDSVDSHYIAFKTNKNIDDLHEADVTYSYYYKHTKGEKLATDDSTTEIMSLELENPEDLDYEYYTSGTRHGVYFDNIPVNIYHTKHETTQRTLSEDDIVSGGGQIFVDEYEYARIQSVDEFIEKENSNEELSDHVVTELNTKEWVLRFLETSFIDNSTWTTTKEIYDVYEGIVEEVSILRLKFTNDGVVYNLGVVDNLTSGSQDIDNPGDFETCDLLCQYERLKSKLKEDGAKVLKVIILIITIVLFIFGLKFFIKVLSLISNILSRKKNKK